MRRYAVFGIIGVVLGLAVGVVLTRGSAEGPAVGDPGVGDPGVVDPGVVPDPAQGAFWTDVPRPTGAAPATCSATDASARTAGQSVLQRGRALRKLGLFADLEGADDAAFEAALDRRLAAAWGSTVAIATDDPLIDIVVASLDDHRVWWRDLEADVVEENQVYVQTIDEWSAISSGAFAPVAVKERWDGTEGPIHVTFTIGGEAADLRPAYLYDWIDPRIIVPINEQIAGSGRQLETLAAFDQTAVVLALTSAEKLALATERDWCFAWP